MLQIGSIGQQRRNNLGSVCSLASGSGLAAKAVSLKWKLLEIAMFSEVYPNKDSEDLINKAVILKRNEILIDRDSDEPLACKFCPLCASTVLHKSSHQRHDETIYVIRCDCGWAESF